MEKGVLQINSIYQVFYGFQDQHFTQDKLETLKKSPLGCKIEMSRITSRSWSLRFQYDATKQRQIAVPNSICLQKKKSPFYYLTFRNYKPSGLV